MPIAQKSFGHAKKRAGVRRLGYAGLARQAVPLLELLFWSYQSALVVAKLDLTPLQLAFLRRGGRHEWHRFHEVANWTRASNVQISRAAKDLEKRGLIKIGKGTKDRRKRFFSVTTKANLALITADKAFESDLLVLMNAGPANYSKRLIKVVRHLRHLNGYFMDIGVINLRYHWPHDTEDPCPSIIKQMSLQDRMFSMFLNFSYDPDYKIPEGAFPNAATNDDDEPPY
jgi:DNA-binding MarR family transcriptional regulator